jgi:hypothetical protein
MTAQELIEQLKTFHPSDEVEIQGYQKDFDRAGEPTWIRAHKGDACEITHNNGARRRILIKSNAY